MIEEIKRGDIFIADLEIREGTSIQRCIRPVVITQINFLNGASPTYVCYPLTTRLKKVDAPYHVVLPQIKGLAKTSMVLAETKIPLVRNQILKYVGHIPPGQMKKITKAGRWVESEGKHHWSPNTFKNYKHVKEKRRQRKNRKNSQNEITSKSIV